MSNVLFGLNIAQIVNDSIAGAGGVLTGTLIKVTTGTRTPGNLAGGTNNTETPYSFQGFIDNRSEVRRNGSLVSQGGQFVSILGASLPAGIEPETNDVIEIENTRFEVIGVPERDPAAALYECLVATS